MISKRVVFYSDKISPRREPKPCRDGHHVGPLINTERYQDAAWALFRGNGECAKCGSTIREEDLSHPRSA